MYIIWKSSLLVNGKYQEKMKRSVSQLSMILEGNRGMDKSKKENIYLALFLMFSEFITLGKKIKATLQISDSEEGKCIYSFNFFYSSVYLSHHQK